MTKYLNPFDTFLLVFIIQMMSPFFLRSQLCAQEILKISPSEIFDGIPEASFTPAPAPSSTPAPAQSPGTPEMTSPTASLRETLYIPTPTRTPIVFDNSALEKYIAEHPTPAAQPSDTPVPIPGALAESPSEPRFSAPDIEALRKKLHEDTPAGQKSDTLILPLSIDFQGGDSRWGEPGVCLILDYQCSSLFASLSITPLGNERKSVTILKNAKGKERCLVDPGQYLVTGKFWLPKRPDLEIPVSFGTHVLRNYATYLLTFDNALEQTIKEEMDSRIQERDKIRAREGKESVQ